MKVRWLSRPPGAIYCRMSAPHPSSRRGAFVAAVVLALALLGSVLLPLWRPLFLACVLAASLARWQDGLARRLGGRRSLAAGLLTLAVVLVVLGPLATLAGIAAKEAAGAVQMLHRAVEGKSPGDLVAMLPGFLQGWASKAMHLVPSWSELGQRGSAESAAAAGYLGNVLSSTSELLFEAAMMLVALFFLLMDGHRLVAWLRRVSPLGVATTAAILHELRATGTSVLTSLLATAAVQGFVATLGYLLARVPQPIFFGLLTFLAAFIPSVGTSIVILPVAAGLLLTGHLWAGLFLAAWGIFVTGTIDNVLKPLLARGGADLHGGVIFFAMIGGIVMYGTLGLLVGPLAVSLLLALARVAGRGRAADEAERGDAGDARAPARLRDDPRTAVRQDG